MTLPDIVLPAHTGEEVSLRAEAARGNGLLLAFVPYAFTPVCASELRELAASAPAFAAEGAAVLVVSCDSKYALRAWAERELGESWDAVRLLSDFWPHGRLTAAMGVMDEARGGPRRTALLTDAAGEVVAVEEAAFGGRRDFTRLLHRRPGLRACR
ncbi:redoxin domain-containing protein [Brevibacterium album]|uniref:redoxin domain-containing protein n=1 Tax=Brevibacterium album TaxID=417948 RepID=UPI0003FAB5FC|nr:redoxin domain-containing protein [Brevibacterium album]